MPGATVVSDHPNSSCSFTCKQRLSLANIGSAFTAKHRLSRGATVVAWCCAAGEGKPLEQLARPGREYEKEDNQQPGYKAIVCWGISSMHAVAGLPWTRRHKALHAVGTEKLSLVLVYSCLAVERGVFARCGQPSERHLGTRMPTYVSAPSQW